MQGLLIMDLGRNTHRYYFCIHRREKVGGDSFGITQHQFICIHFAQNWGATGENGGAAAKFVWTRLAHLPQKSPSRKGLFGLNFRSEAGKFTRKRLLTR